MKALRVEVGATVHRRAWGKDEEKDTGQQTGRVRIGGVGHRAWFGLGKEDA